MLGLRRRRDTPQSVATDDDGLYVHITGNAPCGYMVYLYRGGDAWPIESSSKHTPGGARVEAARMLADRRAFEAQIAATRIDEVIR